MPAKRASARGAKATKAVEKAAEVPAEPITIHVSGLQRPWQDAELKEVLVNAAGTEATEYRVNETRSDAYITFPDAKTAELAIEALNGKPLNDKPGTKALTVRIYDPAAIVEAPEPEVAEEPTTTTAESAEDKQALREKREAERKENQKTTVAEPPVTYNFRPKELVEHIRRRRGYELDSSSMARRVPGRKRRHHEIKTDEQPEAAAEAIAAQ